MGEDTHSAEVGVEQRDMGWLSPVSGPASWSSYEFSVFILAILDFKQKYLLWSSETDTSAGKDTCWQIDNLIPVPGPHMAKGKNWYMQVILWPAHKGMGRGRGRKRERELQSSTM